MCRLVEKTNDLFIKDVEPKDTLRAATRLLDFRSDHTLCHLQSESAEAIERIASRDGEQRAAAENHAAANRVPEKNDFPIGLLHGNDNELTCFYFLRKRNRVANLSGGRGS